MTVIVVCKQVWYFDLMNVITVCFLNISKDLKPKPDYNYQTGKEQARISFIVMVVELRPGVAV
jgi:hypothetical protein